MRTLYSYLEIRWRAVGVRFKFDLRLSKMATEGRKDVNVLQSRDSEKYVENPCQPCLENGIRYEAVGVCNDCHEYLCQKCFDIHTLPTPSRNHTLLTLQKMAQKGLSLNRHDRCTEKCDLHDDEIIKYYCTTHSELGCSACVALNHRTCESVTYIPEAAKNLVNNNDFKVAVDQLYDMVKSWGKVKEGKKHKTITLQQECSEAILMVRKFGKDMNKYLDENETALAEMCQTMKSEGIKTIAEIFDSCKLGELELNALVATVDSCRKKHQNCRLYISMIKQKDKLKALESLIKNAEEKLSSFKQEIKFIPNTDTIEAIKRPGAFGQLSEKAILSRRHKPGTSVSENATMTTRGTLHAKTIVKAELFETVSIKHTSDRNCCLITGMVALTSNKLILVDGSLAFTNVGNNNVKLYDLHQKNVNAQLQLSCFPWDVAIVTESQVVVTVPYDRTMLTIKVSASNLTVEKTLKLQEECWGVDCRGDKLAVSYVNPDKVQVLTLEGDLLHSIESIGQILSSHYVVFSQDADSLIVSCWGSDRVVRVGLDGTVVATYADKELKYPVGLFTDKLGNVYMCGYNSNNVHQITNDCTKIRVLLCKDSGLSSPMSICFNEKKNEIYVGMDRSDNINIYKAVLG